MGCDACGIRATIKERDRVELADLPAFGCPVTPMWSKRRWRCGDLDCEVGTWTEDRPDIAPARATMTRRAGLWATTQVGRHVHSVSWAAKEELGVAWHTTGVSNGPTEGLIIWSGHGPVVDVVDEGSGTRG
jgi:hypothetical protein